MFEKIEQSNLWDSMTGPEFYKWISDSVLPLPIITYSFFIWGASHLNEDKKPELANLFYFSMTLFLVGLTTHSLRLCLKKMLTNINVNKNTACDFYTSHSNYPENIIPQSIFCPILRGHSSNPVCISYLYKNRVYTHVYDYPSLIEWFNSNTICPSANINLLGDDVTNLKFSFDIPPEFLIKEELTDEDHSNFMRI